MPTSSNINTFRPIGTLLKPGHLAGVPLFRVIEQLQSMQQIWRAVVNAELAKRSRPTHYADGQLTICADSPVWASTIRHHQISLLEHLRTRGLHDLQTLRVRVLPIADPPRTTPMERRRTSHRVVKTIRASAEAIPDTELRAALFKLSRALRR